MSGLEDIPLIGDVAETAIHGARAIGDAVTGDWEGMADQAQSMAGSALGVATGGISTAVEDVYDAAAPALGLPDSHQIGHDVLQGVGNALGDGVYNLTHPGEDPTGGGDPTGGLSGILDGGLGDGGLLPGGTDSGDPGMTIPDEDASLHGDPNGTIDGYMGADMAGGDVEY